MRTTILTTRAHAETARAIGGPKAEVISEPLSSPALSAYVSQTDTLMVFLHPNEAGDALRNDAGDLTIAAEQIRKWALAGATVFLGACYGEENEDILQAFRIAGAAHIVAGAGVNVGGVDGLSGADLLARAFRTGLTALPAIVAWWIARLVVWLAAWRSIPGAEDALGYRLDSDGQEGAGLGKRVARIAGALLTLAAMAWALIFGGYEGPELLTFFSSIVNPPAGITWWDKAAYVNGGARPITDTVALVDGDTLSVTDWITASQAFTLTEAWSTSATSLTSWITAGGGSVSTGSGTLTWAVPAPVSTTRYHLTKTWGVVAGSWTNSTLVETLETSTTRTSTITLGHTASTPTPTPYPTSGALPTIDPTVTASPTPVPTWTPYYTPTGWSKYLATAVPTPTPTPCILNCDPLTSTAGITYALTYDLYLPLLARNYKGPAWTSALYVNDALTDTTTPILTAGDTLMMRDTLYTGRGYTFTLRSWASGGLTLTGAITNTPGAAMVTGTRAITWTVRNYGGGTLDASYNVGAGVTETITRVWSYWRGAGLTIPTQIMTDTLLLYR